MSGGFGDLQLPTVAATEGTASGDPLLDTLLSFFKAVITADAQAGWSGLAAGQPIVRRVFTHNPANEAFRPATTPALYLWRDSIQRSHNATAGWRVRPSRLMLRWVPFMANSQERLRRWEPFINVLPASLDQAIERGRHPAWVIPGDTDPQAARFGSLLWSFCNVHRLEVARDDVRRTPMAIQMEGGAPAQPFEVLDIPLALEELLNPDLAGTYDELAATAAPTLAVAPDLVGAAAGLWLTTRPGASQPVTPLAPTLASITPSTAFNLSDDQEIVLTGTNLFANTEVLATATDGTATRLTAVWESETQLRVYLPRVALLAAGTQSLTARRVTAGGATLTSNAVVFTVAPRPPAIASVTPTLKHLSDATFTLYVDGQYFTTDSVIRIDGVSKPTTFVDVTRVACVVAPLPYSTGTHNVLVVNSSGTSNLASFALDHAAPTLTSLSSTSSYASLGARTISLTGTGFDNASVVTIDATAATTTLVSTTQLTAVIPAPVTAVPGAKSIAVTNPAPGGGTSGALIYTALADPPAITSISPTTKHLSDTPFTLTVVGTGFVTGATIRVDGLAQTTIFVSTTQLTCTVSPAAFTAGNHTVDVTGTTGASGTVTLAFDHAAPTLTSIAPNTGVAGSGAQTLTLTGTGFDTATTAYVDGVAMVTVYASSTGLTATLPSTATAATGSRAITVANPTPGGGTSTSQTYVVASALAFTSLGTTSVERWSTQTGLLANGAGFVAGTVVNVNGSARTTTFVSSTQVSFSLLATDVVETGTLSVTVANPSGEVTSARSLTVTQASILLAEWRADTGRTMNGTAVQVLADVSGRGDANQNLTQTDITKQLAFTAANSAYGNQATCQSPSTTGTAWMQTGTWATRPTLPYRIYWVGNSGLLGASVQGGYGQLTDGIIPSARAMMRTLYGGTPYLDLHAGSGVATFYTDVGAKSIFVGHFASGANNAKFARSAKTLTASATDIGSQTFTGLMIGTSYSGTGTFLGTFAHCLVVSGASITTAQHNAIMDYLGAKYAISVGS